MAPLAGGGGQGGSGVFRHESFSNYIIQALQEEAASSEQCGPFSQVVYNQTTEHRGHFPLQQLRLVGSTEYLFTCLHTHLDDHFDYMK